MGQWHPHLVTKPLKLPSGPARRRKGDIGDGEYKLTHQGYKWGHFQGRTLYWFTAETDRHTQRWIFVRNRNCESHRRRWRKRMATQQKCDVVSRIIWFRNLHHWVFVPIYCIRMISIGNCRLLKWPHPFSKRGHCAMCREIIQECQSGHAPRKYENGRLIMDGAENRRGEVHMRGIYRTPGRDSRFCLTVFIVIK